MNKTALQRPEGPRGADPQARRAAARKPGGEHRPRARAAETGRCTPGGALAPRPTAPCPSCRGAGLLCRQRTFFPKVTKPPVRTLRPEPPSREPPRPQPDGLGDARLSGRPLQASRQHSQRLRFAGPGSLPRRVAQQTI